MHTFTHDESAKGGKRAQQLHPELNHTFTHDESVKGGKRSQELHPELKQNFLKILKKNQMTPAIAREYRKLTESQEKVQSLVPQMYRIISTDVVNARAMTSNSEVQILSSVPRR